MRVEKTYVALSMLITYLSDGKAKVILLWNVLGTWPFILFVRSLFLGPLENPMIVGERGRGPNGHTS